METKVLVVSENVEVAASLKTLLVLEGYVPVVEMSEVAARERLRADTQPRAILLDIDFMGRADCRTFLDELFRAQELAWIPVILLSASSDAAQLVKDLRVYGHARKPFLADDLLALVDRAVRLLPKGRNGNALKQS
jgi:CheY-like chemotaxis protein